MTDQKLETVLELALSTDEAQREQSNTLDVGYDPATKRWELIVKYSGSPVFPDFVTFFPLFGGYAIVSIPENYIPTLSEMPEIEYIEKPKNLVLSLYEARAASCITPVQNPPCRWMAAAYWWGSWTAASISSTLISATRMEPPGSVNYGIRPSPMKPSLFLTAAGSSPVKTSTAPWQRMTAVFPAAIFPVMAPT